MSGETLTPLSNTEPKFFIIESGVCVLATEGYLPSVPNKQDKVIVDGREFTIEAIRSDYKGIYFNAIWYFRHEI